MERQETKFGPGMRNIEFRAQREREEAAGDQNRPNIFLDEATGELRLSVFAAEKILARFRARWLWMACVQMVVIAIATGWVLFTQYRPGLPIASPNFMMCLLMIAGAGVSAGIGVGSGYLARLDAR